MPISNLTGNTLSNGQQDHPYEPYFLKKGVFQVTAQGEKIIIDISRMTE